MFSLDAHYGSILESQNKYVNMLYISQQILDLVA